MSATGAGAAPPARGLEFLDDFSNPDLARYYEIVPGVGVRWVLQAGQYQVRGAVYKWLVPAMPWVFILDKELSEI